MKLLIDTHVFVWWDQRLSAIAPALRAAIEDPENEVSVSAASIWEIAIKRGIGKLSFARHITDTAASYGFSVLPISGAHAEHAGGLPHHHRDPFDRLLVAQAELEDMVLGTQDSRLRLYGVATLGLERG